MTKNKYISEEEKTKGQSLNDGMNPIDSSSEKDQSSGTDETSGTENKEKKNRLFSTRGLVQLMNGEFLTRDYFLNNLPFTFFIGFLLVFVIAWGYYGETVTKKEVQLEKELGELNSEFYTLAADYNMQRGRRQIAMRLEPTGVTESTTSPKKIRVRKYVFE